MDKKRLLRRKRERAELAHRTQGFTLESGLTGLTATVLGKTTQVNFTPDIVGAMKNYNLSETMVLELANTIAGYPIADMRTMPALIRRGIMQKEGIGFSLTDKGKSICDLIFHVWVEVADSDQSNY